MGNRDEFDLDVRFMSDRSMWASQPPEPFAPRTGNGGNTCQTDCGTCHGDTNCGTCPGQTCNTQCGQNTCPLTQCNTCITCGTNCQQDSCPGGHTCDLTCPNTCAVVLGGGHTCAVTCPDTCHVGGTCTCNTQCGQNTCTCLTQCHTLAIEHTCPGNTCQTNCFACPTNVTCTCDPNDPLCNSDACP